jgi:hypothetical protein
LPEIVIRLQRSHQGGKMKSTKAAVIGIGFAGCLAGGFVGFLLRPSAFLVGQLPFQHVISRGESLQGVERVMMTMARDSFNIMMSGAVIGLIAGVIIGYFAGKMKSR